MQFNTALLHEGFSPDKQTGATLTPVYQVSAFAHESAEQLEKVFNNKAPGFAYTRIGNPTVDAFEKRMTALEHGIGAVACASGMTAVAMALLNLLESGDEVIAGAGLFGGTIDLFKDLQNFGIKTHFVDSVTAESIEPLLQNHPHVKVVFTELIGNPKLDVVDLRAVSDLVHSKQIPLLIDSTTATPYLIHPFEFGADVIIHSTSKYINGSGNAISGVIIDSGNYDFSEWKSFAEYHKYGKFAYLAKLRNDIWRNIGGCLSPANAFLNSIGLETLGLRMERICSNALQLAQFLEQTDGISVNYPALESSAYHGLAQKQFGGKGGGILTLRAGSKQKAFKLINHLQYALSATNIGDVRTLVIHPASTIYTHNTPEQQEHAGVYEDTIRVSVGIEDIADLISDFAQAVTASKEEV